MDLAQRLSGCIRDIPDFPKAGIIFKDITPILKDPVLVSDIIRSFSKKIDASVTGIAGIESRGFIFGSLIAAYRELPFVPIRKKGKLPYKTYQQSYDLEYGTDSLEIHTDAFTETDTVIMIDDLLATGGSMEAAVKLVESCHAKVAKVLFVVELGFLAGRNRLKDLDVYSLVTF